MIAGDLTLYYNKVWDRRLHATRTIQVMTQQQDWNTAFGVWQGVGTLYKMSTEFEFGGRSPPGGAHPQSAPPKMSCSATTLGNQHMLSSSLSKCDTAVNLYNNHVHMLPTNRFWFRSVRLSINRILQKVIDWFLKKKSKRKERRNDQLDFRQRVGH